MRCWFLGLGCFLWMGAGCVTLETLDPSFKAPETRTVNSSPFGAIIPVSNNPGKVNYLPAGGEVAIRVDTIGKQILAANPDIGFRPAFITYGTPKPEVFHTGTSMVHITQGLVERCKTDAELAAILSHELAEIVVERELLANPRMRNPEHKPPPQVLLGNGAHTLDPGDLTRMAEIGKFEKRREKDRRAVSIPDTNTLASRYLDKSGFHAEDLRKIEALLQEADRNFVLEKQFKQTTPPHSGRANSGWVPAGK